VCNSLQHLGAGRSTRPAGAAELPGKAVCLPVSVHGGTIRDSGPSDALHLSHAHPLTDNLKTEGATVTMAQDGQLTAGSLTNNGVSPKLVRAIPSDRAQFM
jgi:hypothetical protein